MRFAKPIVLAVAAVLVLPSGCGSPSALGDSTSGTRVEVTTTTAASQPTALAGHRGDHIPDPLINGGYSYRGYGRFQLLEGTAGSDTLPGGEGSGPDFFWRDGRFVWAPGRLMEVDGDLIRLMREKGMPFPDHQPTLADGPTYVFVTDFSGLPTEQALSLFVRDRGGLGWWVRHTYIDAREPLVVTFTVDGATATGAPCSTTSGTKSRASSVTVSADDMTHRHLPKGASKQVPSRSQYGLRSLSWSSVVHSAISGFCLIRGPVGGSRRDGTLRARSPAARPASGDGLLRLPVGTRGRLDQRRRDPLVSRHHLLGLFIRCEASLEEVDPRERISRPRHQVVAPEVEHRAIVVPGPADRLPQQQMRRGDPPTDPVVRDRGHHMHERSVTVLQDQDGGQRPVVLARDHDRPAGAPGEPEPADAR